MGDSHTNERKKDERIEKEEKEHIEKEKNEDEEGGKRKGGLCFTYFLTSLLIYCGAYSKRDLR